MVAFGSFARYWTALANTIFYGGSSRIHVVKAAILVNLISSKIVDGIAKVLTKTDLLALSTAKYSTALDAMEDAMSEAQASTDRIRRACAPDTLRDNELTDAVVRVGNRLLLLALRKKEAEGLTAASIKGSFVSEVSALKLDLSCCKKWKPIGWADDAASAQARKGTDGGVDGPLQILQSRLGVKIGSTVQAIGIDANYTVDSIDDDDNIIVRECPIHPSQTMQVYKVTVPNFVQQWKLSRTAVLSHVAVAEANSVKSCFPHAKLQVKLMAHLREQEEQFHRDYDGKIGFAGGGNIKIVYPLVKVAKGALQFAPYTAVSNIDKWSEGMVKEQRVIMPCGTELRVRQPPVPSAKATDAANSSAAVLPFWWVDICKGDGNTNMAFKCVEKDDMTYHILVNTKAVEPFTPLRAALSFVKQNITARATVVTAPPVVPNQGAAKKQRTSTKS